MQNEDTKPEAEPQKPQTSTELPGSGSARSGNDLTQDELYFRPRPLQTAVCRSLALRLTGSRGWSRFGMMIGLLSAVNLSGYLF